MENGYESKYIEAYRVGGLESLQAILGLGASSHQQSVDESRSESRHPVSAQRYDALAAELHESRRKIIEEKRPAYTQASDNTIRNFQQVADLTGLTPGQVLAVYYAKHVISVMNILTGKSVNDPETASRFADMMNYGEIGYVMWKDGKLD